MPDEIDLDELQESMKDNSRRDSRIRDISSRRNSVEGKPAEPSDDDLDEVLRLMGISCHYLETVFLKEMEAAGWDRTAKISDLEGLAIEVEESQSVMGSVANRSHVSGNRSVASGNRSIASGNRSLASGRSARSGNRSQHSNNTREEAKEEISHHTEDDVRSDDKTSVQQNRPTTPKRDNTNSQPKKPKPSGPPVILSKGADVLCPIDGQTGAAYVHCLLNSEGDCPVGFANIYLLYANQYTIGDVLDTLGDYCSTYGKDPKEVFVWMYCFSANLHRITQIQREDNLYYSNIPLEDMEAHYETIKARIINIGHVMPMLSPWKEPILLKRSWATLELYAAQEVIKEQTANDPDADHIEVSVVFPPAQKMDLEINMLIDNNKLVLDKFYKTLGSIKVQASEAALFQDRNGVLTFANEHGLGRPQYNLQCNQVCRAWYRVFKEEIIALPQHTLPQKYPLKPLTLLTVDTLAQQYAVYFEQLAVLFENNEEPEAAHEMKARARNIRSTLSADDPEEAQQEHIPEKPLTFYNGALKLAQREDWDGAILALGKTMAVFESAYGNTHIATGTVYYKIGDMLLSKSKAGLEPRQNKQGAMIAYKRALDVQEVKLGKLHPVTCTNTIQLGLYLEARGKFDDALEYYTNGQALLGTYAPIAVKPFLTLEKKFLLKNMDEAAELARDKGQAVRDALGITEELLEEEEERQRRLEEGEDSEPEPAEGEEGEGEGGEEGSKGSKEQDGVQEGVEAAEPMADLEDESENNQEAEDPDKPEVNDLLAEFRRLANTDDPSEAAMNDPDDESSRGASSNGGSLESKEKKKDKKKKKKKKKKDKEREEMVDDSAVDC